MVHFTFAAEFNAVHRLWNDELGSDENLRIFGECANPSGHGHLYRIEVTVAGEVSRSRPVVIDRSQVQDTIDLVLSPKLRNGDLNTAFARPGFISTGENVSRAIYDLLGPTFSDGARLVSVRVIETPKNSFSCGAPARSELSRPGADQDSKETHELHRS